MVKFLGLGLEVGEKPQGLQRGMLAPGIDWCIRNAIFKLDNGVDNSCLVRFVEEEELTQKQLTPKAISR